MPRTSGLEEAFFRLWSRLIVPVQRLPLPEREVVFAAPRKWKFDFAWPAAMLAVEIEGGTFIRGRHTRPKGYQQDCEKYNAAVLRGWRVLRYTRRDLERRPKQVVDEVAQALQRLLGETRGNHGDTESTED